MGRSKIPPGDLEWVQAQLARCHTGVVVERRIAAQFGISRRHARRYVRRAWDEIKSQSDATREERREKLRLTLEKVLDDAMGADDRKHAILAGNALAKLDGLDAPETVRHELAGGLAVTGHVDQEAAMRELEALRAKHAKKPSDG